MFKWRDGKWIKNNWSCEFDSDWSDGSDEDGWKNKNWNDGKLNCDNGRCI